MIIDAKVTISKMCMIDLEYRQIALIKIPKHIVTTYEIAEIQSVTFLKTRSECVYTDFAINTGTIVILSTDSTYSYKCHERLIIAVKKALHKLDELIERHQKMLSMVENFPEMEYTTDEFLEKYK